MPELAKPKKYRHVTSRNGRSLMVLATIGLLASSICTTQAQSRRHEDAAFYNSYVVETYNNSENTIKGYAVSTQSYNPEQHAKAMRYLS